MVNTNLEILRHCLQGEQEFRERVHVPMTPDGHVAVNYYDGSANMKTHTAELQVVLMEDAALIRIDDFRQVGWLSFVKLKLGSIRYYGESPLQEPDRKLGGYLIALHQDGPSRLAGMTDDEELVELDGVTSGHIHDLTVATLNAIGDHMSARRRKNLE